MNKKGFTLIEVIVSIVLVSVVLASMLASLVKLKTSYEVVSENTDALIFSSSLSRIINNDFDSNGGIRYIDCTYFGDVCDITLNNNEKRRLEIKSVQSGLTWHQHYEQYAKQFGVEISGLSNDKKQIFFKNIAIKLNKKYNGKNEMRYFSLADFYSDKLDDFIKDDADKVRKLVVEGDSGNNVSAAFKSQYCEKIDSGVDSYLSGMCSITKSDAGTYEVSCDCTKQEVSTSLVYSNVTNGVNENIYVKTLSLFKEQDLYFKDTSGKFSGGTGKISTNGYNFGKLSYTNISYDNTSRAPLQYTDTISLISIEVNDGIDVMDTSYNISLSSSSSYPTDSTQIGNLICFDFDNFGVDSNKINNVSHMIDNFCITYGVNFTLKKDSYYTKIEKFIIPDSYTNPSNCEKEIDDPENLRNVCHTPFIPTSETQYQFGGYVYDKDHKLDTTNDRVTVIDASGNIKISSTYFDSSIMKESLKPRLFVKWCAQGDTDCLKS